MELNENQLEAIAHKEGPLLILAGAGSGKTTVLAERYKNLIEEEEARPKNILCVTFTNKAVFSLKNRIDKLVPNIPEKELRVFTFHGLCLMLLRSNKKSDFAVAHTHQARQFIKDIAESFQPEKPKKGEKMDELTRRKLEFLKPSNLQKIISLLKSELVTAPYLIKGDVLSDYIDQTKLKKLQKEHIDNKQLLANFKKIFYRYQQKLNEERLIDVDDILINVVKRFDKNPKFLKKCQHVFRHIMVDEFQDTNRAQYVLTKLLASENRNIVAVGDDFQSIYAFRGGDIRNILYFNQDYQDAKVITLGQNYRSTQTIVDAANELISHNTEQKEKELFTNREKGEPIFFRETETNMEEAEYIAKKIKELVSSGYRYEDISIFYRNNVESSVFETVLPKEDIPFIIAKEAAFLERKEIKDVLSYLSFILDPTDKFHFKQIINTPKRGIGLTTITKIIDQASDQDYLKFCANPTSIDRLNDKTKQGLDDFVSVVSNYQEKMNDSLPSEIIEQLLEDIDYRSSYAHMDMYIQKEKDDYLNKLLELTREMEQKSNNKLSLDAFVKQLLVTDVDANLTGEEFNKVQLSTIHASKGLEFPVVFLTGMKENGFPSKFATSSKAIEEERRLAYVGMTRAKDRLFMTKPKYSFVKDEKDPKEKVKIENETSRFVSEFNQDLLYLD